MSVFLDDLTADTEPSAPTALGSSTVAAIEAAWAAIVAHHPEVPADVVVITGTGRTGSGLTRGHYRPNGWRGVAGAKHEIFLSGERLADGGLGTMTTLVHEAVHALAAVRGLKDTSRQYRYHNGTFRDLATELGMVPPAAPDTTLGYSDCHLAAAAVERYAGPIAALDADIAVTVPFVTLETLYGWANVVGYWLGAWSTFLPWYVVSSPAAMVTALGGRVAGPARPRAPKVLLRCDCREVTVSATVAEALGAILCAECSAPLTAARQP